MRTGYKLTTRAGTTYCGFQWTPSKWVKTSGDGPLCSPAWTHWYDTPELAAFLNPIHADIADPILWRGETDGKFLEDHGLKYGATRGRILEQVPLPEITTEQRVEVGIVCALLVCHEPRFVAWAEAWLSGHDRSPEAAWAARAAARARHPLTHILADIIHGRAGDEG